MFPIPWNFPFRKKNGNLVNIGDAIDEGTELPEHGEGDAGKVLSVDENGDLEWSDDVNSEIQTLTNNLSNEVETRAELGAHNLLPCTGVTKTVNGVTYTVNADKSITVSTESGGATANYTFEVFSGDLHLEAGKSYILSGCPNGGTDSSFFLQYHRNGVGGVKDYGSNASFTASSTTGTDNGYIYVASGTVITTPITFYPMIRLSSDPSTEYTPYAMTNRELTDVANSLKNLPYVEGTTTALGNLAANLSLNEKNVIAAFGNGLIVLPFFIFENGANYWWFHVENADGTPKASSSVKIYYIAVDV